MPTYLPTRLSESESFIVFQQVRGWIFKLNLQCQSPLTAPPQIDCYKLLSSLYRKLDIQSRQRKTMATASMHMFKIHIHRPDYVGTLFSLTKPCIRSHGWASFPFRRPRPQFQKKYRSIVRAAYIADKPKAVAAGTGMSISVTATITVKLTTGGILGSLVGLTHGLDDIVDLLGKSLLLELVSAELDPRK